jgi:hypothetical protein
MRRTFALRAVAAMSVTLIYGANAIGFENDVHFGLTQWLALQAGFSAPQAEAIALGNSRVDSGDMQFVDLAFDYACLAPDPEASRNVARHHFATGGATPGPPGSRAVAAGSPPALQAVEEVMKAPPSHAGLMLFRLGYGLHALQDSWSHQGTPDVPQIPGQLFTCDPTLAWAHPESRGGWNAHRADLTMHWPADTMAMAKATYDVLTRYPPIGAARAPRDWSRLSPALDGFIKAATKTEKRAWFVAHGISDAAFLEGTSLKDGAERFGLQSTGRKLPRLPSAQSRQHHVAADVLDFYSGFFAEWMTSGDLDALAGASVAPASGGRSDGFAPMGKRELAARLKLWRIRDHGAAAELAHTPRLSPRQLSAVDALAKAQGLVRYDSPTDALFPLVTKGKEASPLLPFIVGDAPPSERGQRRVVATAKLRHAPNDIVAVVAQRIDDRWRVISIAAAVDH